MGYIQSPSLCSKHSGHLPAKYNPSSHLLNQILPMSEMLYHHISASLGLNRNITASGKPSLTTVQSNLSLDFSVLTYCTFSHSSQCYLKHYYSFNFVPNYPHLPQVHESQEESLCLFTAAPAPRTAESLYLTYLQGGGGNRAAAMA